jgi:hypothetical protein
MDDVQCPFCKEKGFDLPGLKRHFVSGWCPVYEQTELSPTLAERIMARRREQKMDSTD